MTMTDVGAAEDLLAEYDPATSTLFTAPQGSILGEGQYLEVPSSGRRSELEDLPERVAGTLRAAEAAGHEVRTVLGAVPFSADEPARLVVPRRLRRAGPPRPRDAGRTDRAPRGCGEYSIAAEPEPRQYLDAVSRAVEEMRAGEYAKVVLARALRLTPTHELDVAALVAELARRDPGGHTYAVNLGPDGVLFGASPELLVSRQGNRVEANPLAGSVPRGRDPEEDARRRTALLDSAKDRHEHALVVEAVAEQLRPVCRTLDVPAEPSVASTATMWHLSTRIVGEPADESLSAVTLATRLHPTPAVCGSPTGRARTAIGELEPTGRGFYSGMVGWCDVNGDGQWVVTLRCGLADGNGLRIHAGAGIVAESDPESELAETTAKFATLLGALGLSDDD